MDIQLPSQLSSQLETLGEATKALQDLKTLLLDTGAVRAPKKRLDRSPTPVPAFANYHNPALHLSIFAPRTSSYCGSR